MNTNNGKDVDNGGDDQWSQSSQYKTNNFDTDAIQLQNSNFDFSRQHLQTTMQPMQAMQPMQTMQPMTQHHSLPNFASSPLLSSHPQHGVVFHQQSSMDNQYQPLHPNQLFAPYQNIPQFKHHDNRHQQHMGGLNTSIHSPSTPASAASPQNMYMNQNMYNGLQAMSVQMPSHQFQNTQHTAALSSPQSNTLPQKRKINKLACEYCSKLHKKCDGEHPNPCTRCTQKGIPCKYIQRRKRGPKTKRVKTSHNYEGGESSPASQQSTGTPMSPYSATSMNDPSRQMSDFKLNPPITQFTGVVGLYNQGIPQLGTMSEDFNLHQGTRSLQQQKVLPLSSLTGHDIPDITDNHQMNFHITDHGVPNTSNIPSMQTTNNMGSRQMSGGNHDTSNDNSTVSAQQQEVQYHHHHQANAQPQQSHQDPKEEEDDQQQQVQQQQQQEDGESDTHHTSASSAQLSKSGDDDQDTGFSI